MEAYSSTVSITTKAEFDRVAPAIKTLVSMNDEQHFLDVQGNGHTYDAHLVGDSYSICQVTIKSLGAVVE